MKLDSFIGNVDRLIINPLILLLFGVALVYFVWGIYEFIANQESEEKKTAGKSHMVWGIVGITIMMGVWTILGIILKTFNITDVKPETSEVNLTPYTPP